MGYSNGTASTIGTPSVIRPATAADVGFGISTGPLLPGTTITRRLG